MDGQKAPGGRGPQITRRRFLERGGAAVGALAAPMAASWSRSAQAEGGISAPSERVALGFIGPGSRGAELVWEFAGRPDVEPLAVCDVRKDQRERVHGIVEQIAGARRGRGSYGACTAFRDFREVLAAVRDRTAIPLHRAAALRGMARAGPGATPSSGEHPR